jgi:Rps23 Pro-64 3,4-dihydroxylase Tpa1-like proline 4-hydroxylase
MREYFLRWYVTPLKLDFISAKLIKILHLGQYLHSHFIDPHDDRAYKMIGGKQHSRSIAVIYYLTPNWTEEEGTYLAERLTLIYRKLINFVRSRRCLN